MPVSTSEIKKRASGIKDKDYYLYDLVKQIDSSLRDHCSDITEKEFKLRLNQFPVARLGTDVYALLIGEVVDLYKKEHWDVSVDDPANPKMIYFSI